jgi:hypothetical protein
MDRIGEEAMFEQLKIAPAAQSLWAEVRPLVEASWRAGDTGQVIAIARDILTRLGIDPHTPPMEHILIPANNNPKQRSDRLALSERAARAPAWSAGAEAPEPLSTATRAGKLPELETQSRPLASRLGRFSSTDTLPERMKPRAVTTSARKCAPPTHLTCVNRRARRSP